MGPHGNGASEPFGQGGQIPRGIQQQRPMLTVTSAPGRMPSMPPQYRNPQAAAYRYTGNPSTAQIIQSLPELERLRFAQQAGAVPPEIVPQGGIPGGTILPNGRLQVRQSHSIPPVHQLQLNAAERPPFTIPQQQLNQVAAATMNQQRFSQRPAQAMSAQVTAQQHQVQGQTQGGEQPVRQQQGSQHSQPIGSLVEKKQGDSTDASQSRPSHQTYPQQTLSMFHAQQPTGRPPPSMGQQQSIHLRQPSIAQLRPGGSLDVQQTGRPSTPQQSRLPSPRRTPTSVLTPGSITPGTISPTGLNPSIMGHSMSPPQSTIVAGISQQRLPQQVPNTNDPRYSQIRGMVPLRQPHLVHPPSSRAIDISTSYAAISHLDAQRQQLGLMPGMHSSFQPSTPFTIKGHGMERMPVGPGMHLALGAALRVDGAFESREFAYTECLLRGLAAGDRVPQIGDQLVDILTGLTGMKPQIGIWKTECWKAIVNQEELAAASGKLIQSTSVFNGELWVKRYAEPAVLSSFCCLRMYSPEHLVVPSNFPCNARRVNEASASPQLIKLLPTLGFQPRKANTIYCACYLFHHNVGTPESHLMILVQKHFKDEAMTEDMFPGQLVIEVIGRVEEDYLIEPLSKRILDFCRHLQPLVNFHKF